MRIIALCLIAAIAALHVYIAYFEIFAWEERGPAVFASFPPELFGQTVELAINQGTYNAFLAAGLIWSLLITDQKWKWNVAICFLLFVAIAGIVGAATASLRILFVQTVPATLAIICVIFARTPKS
jgi:putative membrane protein